jgi:hypothetical protein
MSHHTDPGRPDDRTAEQLLDGGDGHAALRALLSAAAAPARPEELTGEDAAVAAFLAAPRPARRHRAADLRRFLTAKVIAAVGGLILLRRACLRETDLCESAARRTRDRPIPYSSSE